jgi:hypothetical protein
MRTTRFVDRAVAAAQAQRQLGAACGHDAGEHQPASGRVARLDGDVAGAERVASTSSVPRAAASRRLLVRQRLQVDAAPAARLGQRAQRAGSPLAVLAIVNTGTGNDSRQGAP